jgi:hypothetical protein
MPLAEVEPVPFWYVVEDVSSTVTFCPADVVRAKPDVDTLPTLPDDPPAAGPDRALDPAAPDPEPTPLPGAGCPAVGEEEVAKTMDAAITAHKSAAATTHRLIRLDTSRRSHGRRACSGMVTEVEPPASGWPGGVLDTGRAGGGSWELVGSWSFMVELL